MRCRDVTGPIVFLLYTADLVNLVKSMTLIRTFMRMIPKYTNSVSQLLQSCVSQCISAVGDWMSSNRLQLNTSKTEVLWCTFGRRQHQLPTVPLVVGNDTVPPVSSVRNLGIYVDADLSMRTHVLKMTSGCFAVLRCIKSIRRSVSTTVLQSLMLHWYCHDLIMVALCWLVCQSSYQTGFSPSRMQQRVCFTVYTGYELLNESHSSLLYLYVPVSP